MSQMIKRILKTNPTAQVSVIGEDLYENIVWGDETPIPKAVLLTKDAEIAADAAAVTANRAEIVQAKAAAKADAFVQSFVAMTPAQVSTYVANNVNSLAEARALLSKMALMLLVLAKREFGQ